MIQVRIEIGSPGKQAAAARSRLELTGTESSDIAAPRAAIAFTPPMLARRRLGIPKANTQADAYAQQSGALFGGFLC